MLGRDAGTGTAALSFVALAAATSWNSGNIGPVAGELADDLGVSLGAVGVLGGTTFFAGLVGAKLGAARLTSRFGGDAVLRLIVVCAIAGNLIIAASAWFPTVAAGRALAGLSLGLALVLGPVYARERGGVRLIGVFGAGMTLGVAGAIAAGSLMREAGIEWRLDFVLAAGLALAAFALLPRAPREEVPTGSVLALARRSARVVPAWRLELLFTTALGLPYVLGVWLVPYLVGEVGLAAGLAGGLGAVMYALSAVFRPEGARLEAGGKRLVLLGGIAPIVAAGGLLAIALSDSAPLATAGIALAGVGFALPYASMYDEASRLFPDARVAAIGLFSVGGNVLPLVATPFIGAAIESGDGEAAMLALAAVPLLAGIANLRPVAGEPPAARTTRS